MDGKQSTVGSRSVGGTGTRENPRHPVKILCLLLTLIRDLICDQPSATQIVATYELYKHSSLSIMCKIAVVVVVERNLEGWSGLWDRDGGSKAEQGRGERNHAPMVESVRVQPMMVMTFNDDDTLWWRLCAIPLMLVMPR